ncbi:peptide deformylase [Svornostia abyssi]|uniref:Peptide deformylase n=1 Tax=Svornostia abyssi TaxID=2898438 RepID=A0ABY5PBN2_9ACTN|nr:peptide deformylase [Parviterribacteraceae bacterium J379]
MADEPDIDEREDDEDDGLDPEAVARRQAAMERIVRMGDPVLRTVARPVEGFDGELREEVRWMGQLMHDALGVGLAAPQVGISHRLFVYRVEQDSPIVAVINPELEWTGDETEIGDEGCLSIPGIQVEVERPVHVRVGGLDEHGEVVHIEAAGLEARVIQHEMDHLDGVLILDRTSKDQRKAAMRALRDREAGQALA